jgi:hypothetical protein
MRALAVVLPLSLATSVFGQAAHRNFGSVVFPGGTAATTPGITRNFGSVVFPGGTQTQTVSVGAPAMGARAGSGVLTPTHAGRGQNPNAQRTHPNNGRGTRSAPSYVYAFPVFVGGYDNSYSPQEPATAQEPAAAQEPVPQQRAVPVMIQVGPEGEYTTTAPHQTSTVYQPERRPETAGDPGKAADPPRYLLAFKDHSIYSAVAYWVDGDTLHYFTTGNTHNQASMSLIDRALTERLNRELGIDFMLPPAK